MPHTHTPALFIADATALDFLNSVATPTDTPVDWIGSGSGFLAWIEQAGLAPPEALAALRKHASSEEWESVAAQARSLREWFRQFVQSRMGHALTAADILRLAPLNRLLERNEGYTRIAAVKDGESATLVRQMRRRWRSPESLLLPIAEALAEFVCEEDFSNVKACEGAHCTLMFADHTRGRRRRWCSTTVCGNRAKVAAHRQRRKNAQA